MISSIDDIAKSYQNWSSLLDYVGHKTLVMDTRPNWGLKHYSVMTGMDFIHVITHKEPVVVRVS